MFAIVQRTRARSPEVAVSAGVAVAVGVALIATPGVTALAVPLVVGAGLVGVLLRVLEDPADAARNRWLRQISVAVLGAHLLIGLVVISSGALVQTLGGDAVAYHLGARAIVDHWRGVADFDMNLLPAGKEGFFVGLAALYWVFGPFQVAGIAVNAALAAAAVPLVHDTTRRLLGREAAWVAVVMYAVLPGFLIWTSQLLREAAVVFLLAAAANAAVRLQARTTAGAMAALGGSLALLFTLRANVALLAAAGLIAGVAVSRREVLAGAATGAVVAGLLVLAVVVAGVGERGYELTTTADLKTVSEVRQALATTANSGIAPGADVSTPGDAIRFLPYGLAAFSLGPFPWTATNGRQLAGVLEALTLLVLLPSLVRGWLRAGDVIGRRRLVLGVPALVLAVGLALFVGNYGTVVRERLQVSILILPFVAYGWTLRRRGALVAPAGVIERTG
jgi:hypothetical protein